MLVAATSAAALAIAPAWGASGGRTAQSESFFATGNAAAHWDNSTSNDNDPFSPRLVIVFADGGNIQLRPLFWNSSWTHEDGNSNDWDDVGGTCGALYEQSYDAVKACHPDQQVTAAYIVTDAPYAPYKMWIDNVQYGGKTISQPSDNNSGS
jgi:hypothetical protein